MSNTPEKEAMCFDDLYITMEQCFSLQHKPEASKFATVTYSPTGVFFVTRPYRWFLNQEKYKTTIDSLCAFISIISGKESLTVANVLWFSNPLLKFNTNPGSLKLHIAPNSIVGFFKELVSYKS